MKQRLVDYNRKAIRSRYHHTGEKVDDARVERDLATQLKVRLSNGRVDPQQVRMHRLWDASEDNAIN